MSGDKVPYIKWGDFKSDDPKIPDSFDAEIIDPEPFPTKFDRAVNAIVDGKEVNIPLRATATNKILYRKYLKLLREEKITVGTKLTIKTWLRKSTKDSSKNLRDWDITTHS